jgi:hypothetical protein
MFHLNPIANEETRHLFVDPSIYHVFDINDDLYKRLKLETGYVKPGKVLNLVELCRPKDLVFSVTEEIDLDQFYIDRVLFGMHHNGAWEKFVAYLSVQINKKDAANWGVDGNLVISTDAVFNTHDGEKGIVIPDTNVINIPIKLNYARGSRCLEYSTEGTYDNGKPQILGLTFDMVHKDSKII